MARFSMAYEKFNPDKSDMLAIAIKYNGNISKIAEHYNVSRDTTYEYFKRDIQGKQIIDTVRGVNTESDLDAAEYVIRSNMANYKNNPGLAQRAAEKVIDRKGHLRDWASAGTSLPPNDSILSELAASLKERKNGI